MRLLPPLCQSLMQARQAGCWGVWAGGGWHHRENIVVVCHAGAAQPRSLQAVGAGRELNRRHDGKSPSPHLRKWRSLARSYWGSETTRQRAHEAAGTAALR